MTSPPPPPAWRCAEAKTFPILGSNRRDWPSHWPTSVPWAFIEPHEKQAQRNHGQALARLAERGGLCPSEMVAVLEDRGWRSMPDADGIARVLELLAAWQASAGSPPSQPSGNPGQLPPHEAMKEAERLEREP